MKLLRDPLKRPIPRLFFDSEELDTECERIIVDFMERRSGGFRLPVPTDELTRLIEEEVDDLDLYAELPDGVEGITDFYPDRRPTVRIAERLSAPRLVHRLRTTLAHEYGHVRFHAPLWRKSMSPLKGTPGSPSWVCSRSGILAASESDWMEWQAGYVCGALLIPRSSAETLAKRCKVSRAFPVTSAAPVASNLIQLVSVSFQMSKFAARVRLVKLGFLLND